MSLSPCEAVAIILENDPEVSALRSDRYYIGLNMVPSRIQRPYQYADQRDVTEFRHMTGRTGYANVLFEIETYADTPTACMNLARETRQTLDEYTGLVIDADDGDEFEVISIKLDDESHVLPVPIPNQDSGLAVIRQAYQMIYFRNPETV